MKTCGPTATSLAGEQSGHIIFGKYANTGDGILTAIKLMQAMLSKKGPAVQIDARSEDLSSGLEECARTG